MTTRYTASGSRRHAARDELTKWTCSCETSWTFSKQSSFSLKRFLQLLTLSNDVVLIADLQLAKKG